MGRKQKNKRVKLAKDVKLPIIRELANANIATQLKDNAAELQNLFISEKLRLPNEPFLSYNTRKTFEVLAEKNKLYKEMCKKHDNITKMDNLSSGEKSILLNLESALHSYEQAAKSYNVDQLLSDYNARLQTNSSLENTAAAASTKAPQPAAPSVTLKKDTTSSSATAHNSKFDQLSKNIARLEQAAIEFPTLYEECKDYALQKTLTDNERKNLIRLKEIWNLYQEALKIKESIVQPNAIDNLYIDLSPKAKPKHFDYSKLNNKQKKLLARLNTAISKLNGKTEVNKEINLMFKVDTLLQGFGTKLIPKPQVENGKMDWDVPPPLDAPPPPSDAITSSGKLPEETDSNTESTSSDEEISTPDITQKFSASNAANNNQEFLFNASEEKSQPTFNEIDDELHKVQQKIDEQQVDDSLNQIEKLGKGLEESLLDEINDYTFNAKIDQEINDRRISIELSRMEKIGEDHNQPLSQATEETDIAPSISQTANNANLTKEYEIALENLYLAAKEILQTGQGLDKLKSSNDALKEILEKLSKLYGKEINLDKIPLIGIATEIEALAILDTSLLSEDTEHRLSKSKNVSLEFLRRFEENELEKLVSRFEEKDSQKLTESKNTNTADTPPPLTTTNTSTEDFSVLERKVGSIAKSKLGPEDLIAFMQNNPQNNQILNNDKLNNRFIELLTTLFKIKIEPKTDNYIKIVNPSVNLLIRASSDLLKRLSELTTNDTLISKLALMHNIHLDKEPLKSEFNALIDPKIREKEIDALAAEFAPEAKEIPIKKPRIQFVKGNRPSGKEQSKNLLSKQRVVDPTAEEEATILILRELINKADERKKPSGAETDSKIKDLRAFIEGSQHEAHTTIDDSIHKQIEALTDEKLHELTSSLHKAISADKNTLTIDEEFQNEIREGLASYSAVPPTNNEQQRKQKKVALNEKETINDKSNTLPTQPTATHNDINQFIKDLEVLKKNNNNLKNIIEQVKNEILQAAKKHANSNKKTALIRKYLTPIKAAVEKMGTSGGINSFQYQQLQSYLAILNKKLNGRENSKKSQSNTSTSSREAKPVTNDKPNMNDSKQSSTEDDIDNQANNLSMQTAFQIQAGVEVGDKNYDSDFNKAPSTQASMEDKDINEKQMQDDLSELLSDEALRIIEDEKSSPPTVVKPDTVSNSTTPKTHDASSTAKTIASLAKSNTANNSASLKQNAINELILTPLAEDVTYNRELSNLNARAKHLYGTRAHDNITGHLTALKLSLSEEDKKTLPAASIEDILNSMGTAYKKITNTIQTRYEELHKQAERLIKLASSGVSGNIGQQKTQLLNLLESLKAATQLNMPLLKKELKDALSLNPHTIFADKIEALQKILNDTNTDPNTLPAQLNALKLTSEDVNDATEGQCHAFTHIIENAYKDAKAAASPAAPVSSPLPTDATAAFVSKDTSDILSLLHALPTALPIGPARHLYATPGLAHVTALIEKHEKAKYPQANFSYERKTCPLNGNYISIIHVKKNANALSEENLQLINSESLKVRKLSLIAGMINMINHSHLFLAGPNREQFINKLTELAENIDQETKKPISLDKFIDQLISTAKSFSGNYSSKEILREIRNAERYYVAEKNQQTALVFEHQDKDNKTIYQVDIPLGNKLTDEQKQFFVAIHDKDQTNIPMWFKQLPPFEKNWLRNMVPESFKDDWSAFENLYQSSAMQHIPGIKNCRTNYLAQQDTNGILVLSSSMKASTIAPYEMPKDEQKKQAQQNAKQAFLVLKQKALENKQEKWGDHLKDLPPLIFFQALLSNTILSKDDSKLYASQVEAINNIQATDNSVALIAGTEAVNILGKASPQTKARWEYADQVIAYADNLLKKLQGSKLTPAQEQLVKLITDAKSNLANLKKSNSLLNIIPKLASSENLEAFKAAYLAVLVEAMGGVVSTNCKSGKDRTGLEEIYCHAMQIYFAQEGRLPQLSDKGEQREEFIAIYKQLFDSMKIQEAAAMNTPGSFGINDSARMLSRDIANALGKSYESSTERAVMNKPDAFKKDEEKQAKEMRPVKEDTTPTSSHPVAPAAALKENSLPSPVAAPLTPPSEEPPKPPIVAPAATTVSKAASVPPPSTAPVPPPDLDAKSSAPAKTSSGAASMPNPVDLRRAFQDLFQATAEAKVAAAALKESMRLWQEVREERAKLAKLTNPGSGPAR